MLHDFIGLEEVFGRGNAVLFLDDIMQRYHQDEIIKALQSGIIEQRMVCIGPDCGRCLCYLSEKGRRMACAQVC